MTKLRLTPISYVVLGFVELMGPSTPYDIKQAAEGSIGYFWTFAHTQFYGEPDRLAKAGLMEEAREETGRRRRTFSITPTGREALRDWLAAPTAQRREIRDLAMVKLYFAELAEPGDVDRLRSEQQELHRGLMREMEQLEERYGDRTDLGYRPTTIKWGLMVEKALINFWQALKVDPVKRDRRRSPGR